MKKPHLVFGGGRWHCYGHGHAGSGATPTAAWKALCNVVLFSAWMF